MHGKPQLYVLMCSATSAVSRFSMLGNNLGTGHTPGNRFKKQFKRTLKKHETKQLEIMFAKCPPWLQIRHYELQRAHSTITPRIVSKVAQPSQWDWGIMCPKILLFLTRREDISLTFSPSSSSSAKKAPSAPLQSLIKYTGCISRKNVAMPQARV